MIDICDFAVGLSRQLYGLTIASERPQHRMMEQWHPLGIVGIVTAFNFPVAVWAWNSALAAVCGDSTIWKPSSQTPLTAIATIKIAERICRANDVDPAIFSLVIGDGATIGERLISDPRIPLVSATGSTRMGRHVGEVVTRRLGRTPARTGRQQRHHRHPYRRPGPGHARHPVRRRRHRRPALHHHPPHHRPRIRAREADPAAHRRLPASAHRQSAGSPARSWGRSSTPAPWRTCRPPSPPSASKAAKSFTAASRSKAPKYPGGCYVRPCIVAAQHDLKIVHEETFAPILYLIPYRTLDEAIAYHNEVPQGLSSAIFTNDLREAEQFLSARGSDCGIANVNIGTSGAEIGGAFGGEKETGGGRESGSDAWKAYMRRQTVTINYSKELPLAQGIVFG